MTATDHNKILSILFFVKGALVSATALILVVVYGLMGLFVGGAMLSAGKGEEQLVGAGVGAFMVVFAVVIGVIILLFGGLYLFAGWKMHKQQPSAKIWAVIAGCLALLNFPLGTALGVYTLWFFFGDEGKQLYSGGG